MKKSELRQLIREELENSLNQRNIYQELSDIVHNNEGNLGNITDAVYEWVNQNFTIKNENISESQNEKNYEYFYNRISKGVDKFKHIQSLEQQAKDFVSKYGKVKVKL